MHRTTKWVGKLYGAWALALLAIALFGNLFSRHAEYSMSAHFLLTVTGLPLSLFSWYIVPNGTVLCVLIAGLIGTTQWAVVAEGNARYEGWRQSRRNKAKHP